MWKTFIKILERRACCHDWEIIHEKEYVDQTPTHKWENCQKAHTRMVLKCNKCGKLQTLYV